MAFLPQDRIVVMLKAHPISAFSDNYLWLLENGGATAFVVDPGDAAPVLAALEQRNLVLEGILVTHHHPDHVGGLPTLMQHFPTAVVYGPANSPVHGIARKLCDGANIEVLGLEARIISVPGHTLDHIAYFFPDGGDGAPNLFCGDTLFAGGCGRLFEGNPAMMHDSLVRLAALPATTRVYCAHEYTLSNLRFARAVEPENRSLVLRLIADTKKREAMQPTVPSTLAMEIATNPFLRCAERSVQESASRHGGRMIDDPTEVFATVRAWKDNFR